MSYDDIMMELQLDYDGITDGATMAQASTLLPVTKMKKAQAWTLALSWEWDLYCKHYILYKKIVICHTFVNLTRLLR